MIFTLDTEFIDTPTCSELISLGMVSQDKRELYLEFKYTESEITPWLQNNVVSQLSGVEHHQWRFEQAAIHIMDFIGGSKADPPKIWAYYSSYDWYWFCRIFGGMMGLPEFYPHRALDFANYQQGVPDLCGPPHHALNDAKSLMIMVRMSLAMQGQNA